MEHEKNKCRFLIASFAPIFHFKNPLCSETLRSFKPQNSIYLSHVLIIRIATNFKKRIIAASLVLL